MNSDRESDEFSDDPAIYADLDSEPEEEEEREFGIQPYMFEPLAVGGAAVGQVPVGEDSGRADANAILGNNNWCSCHGGCQPMPTLRESFCCNQCDKVVEKMEEYKEEFGEDQALRCITEHPGFQTVCLDRWCLETAQFHYLQQYGGRARWDATPNE
ncbi:uncharacterized protein LOC135155818 [Lytechinus pictus]|uniref:uncharacterized protein LOC135155818 n=1 Tax=Lytechinus pictus TaxID=7653 RepID=UPI0030BA15FB